MAYYEAQGFVDAGLAMLAPLTTSSDHAVASASTKSIEALNSTAEAFGYMSLTAPVADGPSILLGAAARMELAALKVK